MSNGPLQGLRVADFSQLVQGPTATQLLGDMGADIIKVEPLHGDWQRHWSLYDHFVNGQSMSFLTFNRSKRSIALNLKDPRGKEAALRVIKSSDILIENFRPGVMDRLGLGYETLAELHPRLIYCASCGYGQDGPYKARPGQDFLIQAITGVTWLSGSKNDPPVAIGIGVADLTAALHIVCGVLMAVYEREKSGLGQRVDVNLLNSMMSLATQELTLYFNARIEPQRSTAGVAHPYAGAPFGIYKTKDGYIALAMMPIGKVAELVGVEGFSGNDSRNVIENRDDAKKRLEVGFASKTTEELLETLLGADIWCAPIQSFPEAERDPQVEHNQIIATIEHPVAGKYRTVGCPVRMSRTPASPERPPLAGEHTEEILSELGYTSDQISDFKRDQVVNATSPQPR